MLGIALVHALLMTIFVFDLVSREKDFLISLSEKQAIGLAETLATNGTSWILSQDVIGMEEIIHSQLGFPGLKYALYIDTKGKVLSYTDNTQVGKYLVDSISKSLLKGTITTRIMVDNTDYIDIAAPIMVHEKHIGWARVGISRQGISSNIKKVIQNGILYTLFTIIIGSVFAWFMARGLTQDIRHLERTAHRVAMGERHLDFHLDRSDELGKLGDDFQFMVNVIQDSEKLFKTVINATPDWIFIKDKNFRYLFANQGFADSLKMKTEDFLGKTDDDLGFSKELIYGNLGKGIRGFRADDEDVLAGISIHNPYDPATFHDASLHIFDTYKVPLLDSQNMVYASLGISRDVTERLDMEVKLHQAAVVYDRSSEGILITDSELIIIAVNKAFSLITGYSEKEILGKQPSLLASGKHDKAFYQQMWDELLSNGYWRGEIINRHKDGHLYNEWKKISVLKNSEGVITNYVANFSDISDLKKSEEKLKHMAEHDQLTQLPNRNLLKHHLKEAILRATENNTKIAVFFLDLDNFKQINDTLGHSHGDQVLKDVAHKFKATLCKNDILSRQGGDEFLVVIENIKNVQEVSNTAQKLINVLSTPISISEHDFYVGVSIGISLFPEDGLKSELLIKNADSAMYQSKHSNKNQYTFFTSQLNKNIERRLIVESHLRKALIKNEIYIVYHPQIDINKKQVYGFEALIRWKNPKLGFVSPTEFIPIAEATGLINEIGEFVLQEAIKKIHYWNTKFAAELCISVNISARQFENFNLLEDIKSILSKNNCSPEYLKIEITESLLLQNSNHVLHLLTMFADAEIAIALDDFGTGYSSLSYLKKFPINTLKIDKSFIKDMTKNTEDAVLVRAIISMANGLGMEIIAEGVETLEQLTFLSYEGCHLIQGHYYSKPVNAAEIEKLLLDWNNNNA